MELQYLEPNPFYKALKKPAGRRAASNLMDCFTWHTLKLRNPELFWLYFISFLQSVNCFVLWVQDAAKIKYG